MLLPARVVVVGGVVLDTKVRTATTPVLRTSNPGAGSWSAGGVGRNVAENLARLGTPVTLLAAVGDDPAGEVVLARTATAGVDCRHVIRTPQATGSYTAVLDDHGDLVLAVADLRATDELRPAHLVDLSGLLAAAGLLVVDANLHPDALGWVLDSAHAAAVPVVVEPVSVAKAARVAAVLRPDRPVHTVTPNLDELAALVGHPVTDEPETTGDDADDVGALVAAATELHARGVAHVWVRRGARGSLLVSAGSTETTLAQPGSRPDDDDSRTGHHGPAGRAHVIRIEAPATTVADVTGAGDAMTAGYVHGILAGADVVDAARLGQVCAALTCASPQTVRSDLTPALVATHLGDDRPRTEELPG